MDAQFARLLLSCMAAGASIVVTYLAIVRFADRRWGDAPSRMGRAIAMLLILLLPVHALGIVLLGAPIGVFMHIALHG